MPLPDIEFNPKAFSNYLMFTLSSLVIMFIDTIGSTCVVVQCFIRMCLMSCYNFASSICQILTFLPTCCIFFLTSRFNCFCSTTNICKGNNNSICIVITGIVLIWLLYFGGIKSIIKAAAALQNTTVANTNTSSDANTNTSSDLPPSGDNANSDEQNNQYTDHMRKGPLLNQNFPQALQRKSGKGPFPDADLSYRSEPPDQISRSAHQMHFLHTPRVHDMPSKTTVVDISEYKYFENVENVMSDLFAYTRNHANLPNTKMVHSSATKSRLILYPNRIDTSNTEPLLTNLLYTRKKNGTETMHRDMFRRYWQQGKFCG